MKLGARGYELQRPVCYPDAAFSYGKHMLGALCLTSTISCFYFGLRFSFVGHIACFQQNREEIKN